MMGIMEVVPGLKLMSIRRQMRHYLESASPSALITCDSPISIYRFVLLRNHLRFRRFMSSVRRFGHGVILGSQRLLAK